MDKGVIITPLTRQTRLGLITSAPAVVGDTPSDMPWLNELAQRGTAVTPLITVFSADNSNMVVSFDQFITDIGPLIRPGTGTPSLVPHLTTIGSASMVVLHRFTDGSSSSPRSVVRKVTETPIFGLCPMSTILLSITRIVEIKVTQV